MRSFEFLVESNIISMAKKAYGQLSSEAKSAIDHWETANWTEGQLSKHIAANDHVAQEIEAAFKPIRDQLPNKVTLYRGVVNQEDYDSWKKATLTSWTTDKRVAEHFAGLRQAHSWKSVLHKEISDEEIANAVKQYNKTGFLKFKNKYYVQNKEHPKYYNIYDSSKQFITDGDDLEADLKHDQKWSKEINQEKQSKATVFKDQIDKNRIVWITNSANCKEYIVKN